MAKIPEEAISHAFPTKHGPITGIAEVGLAIAIFLVGLGINKFLGNSSVKAEGPIPPINIKPSI